MRSPVRCLGLLVHETKVTCAPASPRSAAALNHLSAGILRRALAVAIHLTSAVLGIDVTLLGSGPKPFECLSVVLRATLAFSVHLAGATGVSVTLLGRGTIPLECLRVVLLRASPHVVEKGKVVLRIHELIGSSLIPPDGFRVVRVYLGLCRT